MSRRAITKVVVVLAAPVFAVTATTGAASAATLQQPRLAGTWNTTLTVTEDTNAIDNVGDELAATFRFTPQCRFPTACDVVSVRTRPSGSPATVRTVLNQNGQIFTGVSRYVSACFADDGTVTERYGFNTTERTRINVNAVNPRTGVATAFTGRLRLDFALTARGRAAGCNEGMVASNIRSEARTD